VHTDGKWQTAAQRGSATLPGTTEEVISSVEEPQSDSLQKLDSTQGFTTWLPADGPASTELNEDKTVVLAWLGGTTQAAQDADVFQAGRKTREEVGIGASMLGSNEMLSWMTLSNERSCLQSWSD
jgi:hypothetical protein